MPFRSTVERGTHDENINFEEAAKNVGRDRATYVRDKSIEIFQKAGGYAEIQQTNDWSVMDPGNVWRTSSQTFPAGLGA